MHRILIIGSGELGHAITNSLHTHPSFTSTKYSLTTTMRPSTLSSTLTPSRQAQISDYKAKNITVLPLDIETASPLDLTTCFTPFTTIIHASGMTLSPGTQTKVTSAVLASSSSSPSPTERKTYIPWQFGLDYDAIGPTAGSHLFAEQCSIRQLLRSQDSINWVIISNGIFMSFLFEPVWGVVEPPSVPDVGGNGDGDSSGGGDGGGGAESRPGGFTVRGLGSWDDKLVVTTAEDIAWATAELVLVDTDIRGRAVYIAGESVEYSKIAEMVEEVVKRGEGTVKRELWTVEDLEKRRRREPENKLRRYHVVFATGIGTNWDVEGTYNAWKNKDMTGLEKWLRENYKMAACDSQA